MAKKHENFFRRQRVRHYPDNTFVLKMLSAYYVCFIYSSVLQNTLTMLANVMNPN